MSERPASPAYIRSDIPGVAWPVVSSGPAAMLSALFFTLEAAARLPLADIVAHQHRQLGVLATHAAKYSTEFQRRLHRADLSPVDLATPDGLRRLPLLTRRDVQSAGAALFCTQVPAAHQPVTDTHTSGATGEPVVVKRTAVDQLFWSAATIRDHTWHARDVGKGLSAIRANFASYHRAETWGPPMSLLFETGPSQALPITWDVRDHLRSLEDFQPDNLLIYPSTLRALAEHCRQRGVTLPSIRHIRTIGETLSAAVRALAREVFEAAVEDVYSSQEVGIIAIQCPEGDRYHVMAESVMVEVLDDTGQPCRDGEVGRVVLTDLHNFATPLVRYDIGDYAEAAGACPCGRGLPCLRRILGRERNLIAMPDGTRHWPLVGFMRFRDIAPIRQYQLIQQTREVIEVRLAADRAVSAGEEAELRTIIQRALGHAFTLHFTYFSGSLPRPPSGKFEDFVSRVAS